MKKPVVCAIIVAGVACLIGVGAYFTTPENSIFRSQDEEKVAEEDPAKPTVPTNQAIKLAEENILIDNPDSEYRSVMTYLEPDEEVSVVEVLDNGYCKVSYQNQTGYMTTESLYSSVPVDTPEPVDGALVVTEDTVIETPTTGETEQNNGTTSTESAPKLVISFQPAPAPPSHDTEPEPREASPGDHVLDPDDPNFYLSDVELTDAEKQQKYEILKALEEEALNDPEKEQYARIYHNAAMAVWYNYDDTSAIGSKEQ